MLGDVRGLEAAARHAGQQVVQRLLVPDRTVQRAELRIVERQLADLLGELPEAAVHPRIALESSGSSSTACCASRSMVPMRSTSERLARAACEALNTALRLWPARRSVFHAVRERADQRQDHE